MNTRLKTALEVSTALVLALCCAAPSLAGGPRVSKTVGTEPGICAPGSEIHVPAGTTVYYCYRNTISLEAGTSYNITDDILGPIAANTMNASGFFEEFASSTIFVETQNVGTFAVDHPNSTFSRGGALSRGAVLSFVENSTALVVINGSPDGGGQFNGAIPTLSEVALFVFGALLLVGAGITFRRIS